MSNLEKLAAAGLIAPNANLSKDEVSALESMSEVEVSTLISARMHVHEREEEPRVPTFHVSI